LGCCFSNFMQRLRVSPSVDPKYVFYLLNSSLGREHVNYFGQTTTGLRNLTGTILGDVLVPGASLKEQRAIAGFLDRKTAAIDALVAKKERLVELLQEKRQALITQAVTKGLDPNVPMKESGVEWIGRLPAHWSVWTVRNLIRARLLEVQDGNHGELHPVAEDYVPSGVPFLMANNIRDGQVDLEGCKFIRTEHADSLRIGFAREGDVLLTHKGTIGETAILSDLSSPYAMLTPQITYYRPRRTVMHPSYLYLFMASEALQGQMRFIASVQATRDYVGITAQRNLKLAVPPIREQREIATVISPMVERLDRAMRAVRTSGETLLAYRQAVIIHAVTGKIDVTKEAA
jgi:type I restriction enzyme S subunit